MDVAIRFLLELSVNPQNGWRKPTVRSLLRISISIEYKSYGRFQLLICNL